MSQKIFYFDVETTGTDPIKQDVVQIGLIIEIGGEVKIEKNIKCQPINWEEIEPQALEVTGNTIEGLKKLQPASAAYKELTDILCSYVDKYDKSDKFYPAGYNVSFDLDFLQNFFLKQNDPYFGSFINWKRIDPLPILHYLDFLGHISLPDYKLATVCEYFDIEIDAHDAFSDIKATRELVGFLADNFGAKDVAKMAIKSEASTDEEGQISLV
jgi:DNA polymerase III alpha subunit (gram-positive type)